MNYPKSLNNLIENFRLLPGIGEKTAQRLAFTMLDFDKEKLEFFAQSIIDVKNKIKHCPLCNNITENDICDICNNKNREKHIVCIVDDVKTIGLFEKNNIFNGKYHVLNGLISPFDGVSPENSNINILLKRIEKEGIREVIIAIKPTIEGETTALYISKLLEAKRVLVSKLAQGVPMGTEIEYLDAMTLEKALEDRKQMS